MLVVGAGFAVNADEEGFVAEWLDMLAVMPGDEPCYPFDTLLAFKEVFQVYRPLQDFIQFLDVGNALSFGEGEELCIQCLMRHAHFVGGELVVQRQGRAVFYTVGDGIFVQVALVILASESLEVPFP